MFKNAAAEFVAVRTYLRWVEHLGRRETWPEAVDRYLTFITQGRNVPVKVVAKIRAAMLSFNVMPSMRAVWAAGPAAEADNTCIYNCSFAHVNSIESFAETLYILMCGTGVGFAVTEETVSQLPIVAPLNILSASPGIVIEDSRQGWAESVKQLLSSLYVGQDVEFDYSQLRPKGSRLKIMGGRSSGPEPLVRLHYFIRQTFNAAQGRKLTTLECHDIQAVIAEVVVVGGVRRSSEISLSALEDDAMRDAKTGSYPLHRAMANNSAIYSSKPSAIQFLKEWSALAASGSGERGIFNLAAARARAPARRKAHLIDGTNPCGEIMLRDKEFCNLSETVVRAEDTVLTLLDKIEATIWIGCLQSTFTHFPYLSPEWKANCEEERLLGASLTGQMDHPDLLTAETLTLLKQYALDVAQYASQYLGIPMPAAITCVKPSGTVSQLVDSASGLHARHSAFYIRRYRIAATDPLYRMLKSQGVQFSPENGQENRAEADVNTWVVSFPVAAPPRSVTRNQLTAIAQLEHYKKIQTHWCEHNASCTIYVKDEEWFEVGNWVYQNWDYINGVSFLPYDGGNYQQAPYEECTREQYNQMLTDFPVIDYTQLGLFEKEDHTTGASTLACVAGACELN